MVLELGSIGSKRSPGSLGSKVLEVGSKLGIFIIMRKSGGQAADSQKQKSNITECITPFDFLLACKMH